MPQNAYRFQFPPVIEEKFDNGAELLWLPDTEQKTVSVAFQAPFGRFSDPAGLEGAVELLVALVQKGTRSLGAEAFTDKFEFTGSSLFAEIGDEQVIIGCKMLSRFSAEIMPLFWEMVTNPALDEKELSILKRELLTSIQAESTEPSAVASRHFHVEVFGRGHPAGRFHTAESVKKITASVLRNLYETCVVPHGCAIVIAGDFDYENASGSWQPLFQSWTGKSRPQAVVDAPRPRAAARRIRLVDKPDLTQTTLLMGFPVPGELGGERNALALANYVFGGGNFSSRLMTEVRSRMGKTYSIASQMSLCRDFGLFTVSTATRNGQVGEMLDMILSACGRFRDGGITTEELDDARTYAVGNMAFQLEGIVNIAEKLLWLKLYGRSREYIENFPDTINGLPKKEVDAAIRRHLDPAQLSIVAVGAGKEVYGQLEKTGDVVRYHYRDAVR